jgi:hypothetical protein
MLSEVEFEKELVDAGFSDKWVALGEARGAIIN